MNKKPLISKTILEVLGEKKHSSILELREKVVKIVKNTSPKTEYAVTRAVKNLEESGFIEKINSDNLPYMKLTRDGKQKLLSTRLESETTLVSTTWDGFWRIILLDLPEVRKSERDSLRYLLKKAGFACLKNSVWISPYPFEHLFTNVKKDLALTTELIIIVTKNVDSETEKVLFNIFKK